MIRLLRSVAAIVGGTVLAIALSTLTDFALVWAGVFPPLDQSSAFTPPLLMLALAYRTAFGVLGAFVTAGLAPMRPWLHVWILGALGLVASIAGAIVMRDAGNAWYAWGLVALALPTAWLGGYFWESRARTAIGRR